LALDPQQPAAQSPKVLLGLASLGLVLEEVLAVMVVAMLEEGVAQMLR